MATDRKSGIFLSAWLLAMVVVASSISLASYILVDPNLYLLSTPWFVTWQTSLWQWRTMTREIGWGFAMLWSILWLLVWKRPRFSGRLWLASLAGISFLFFIGHNAWSHDIFNYLFNAKMVLVYGANPHVQVALDFASDPWTRFMHNTHTPAPYGYGWTVISLLPVWLAQGNFFLSYWGMKALVMLGYVGLLWATWLSLADKPKNERWERLSLLAWHPLIFIEVFMNGHNDVWMMAPAVAALVLLRRERQGWGGRVASLLFLAFSLSIKYATLALAPLWAFLLWRSLGFSLGGRAGRFERLIEKHWASVGALLMWLPLFTARSQQFHPWYFVWVLSFLPFIEMGWLRRLVQGVAFSSGLRYLPWIFKFYEYTPDVLWQMKVVTWSGVVAVFARFSPRSK